MTFVGHSSRIVNGQYYVFLRERYDGSDPAVSSATYSGGQENLPVYIGSVVGVEPLAR